METQPSHPFFVYGKGWASFSPEEALHEHGLKCQLLEVGDVCISLTPRDQTKPSSSSSSSSASIAAETTGSPQNLSRHKQMPQTISTTATGTTVTSRQIPSYEPSLYSQHQHQQQMMSQRHLSDSIYGMHGSRSSSSVSERKFSTPMAPPPPPSSSSSSSSAAENAAMASYDSGEAIDATMHSRKRRTWSICENICDDPKKSKPN